MNKTIGLILVFVACLALAGYRGCAWSKGRPGEPAYLKNPILYRCTQCGHAFQISLYTLVDQNRDHQRQPGEDGSEANCPSCDAKLKSIQVTPENYQLGSKPLSALPPPAQWRASRAPATPRR